ncbi:MAG: exo-alpha-sialidase, partial [Asticcacaulis sp.]|nr:exo-alpha-sialidase [Asticcacaulis sp.]
GAPTQTPQHAVIGGDGFLYVTFAAGDGKSRSELNPSNVVKGSVWKMKLQTGKWEEITPIRPVPGGETFGYSGIDVDPAHPGTIVTSTIDRWWPEHDDIFLSRDGGVHWLMLTSVSQHDTARFPWLQRDGQVTEPGKDRMGSWISDVKINPFNPDEMIYGTGGGVWMTRNLTAGGNGSRVKFDFADDNLEETAITSLVSPPRGATLLATMGDVGGGGWDDLTKSPPASSLFSPNESQRSVDVAWLHPALVARSTDNKPYGYYSEDGGLHWTAFPSTPPYTPQDAKGNWRTMGPLAVSAGGSSIVWSIPHENAYVSFDLGKNWTASTGWPSVPDATLVPLADRTINGVFYVHDR